MIDFDVIERELYTAVISDVLDSLGYRDQAMDASMRPLTGSTTLAGSAHTMLSVDTYHRINDPYAMEIAAVDSVKPGDVIVAATNSSTRTCLWGELLSTATSARGGRGAIIHGYTRDVRVISEMKFPVFATGTRPVDSAGRSTVVSYAEPVLCGGVLVREGDIVVADLDGIVVIPVKVAEETIRKAQEKVQGENQVRAELRKGRLLRDVFDEYGLL